MLNKRCSQLLSIIINSKQPVNITELSDNFEVSNRTVRYDLDKVDDFLESSKFPKLLRKPNEGISYNCSDEEKSKIVYLLGNIDLFGYIPSQDERVLFILSELLSVRDCITINTLAGKLLVSRSTIIKDIEKVKVWLEERKLKLISFKGYGIKISGDESCYRKAVLELLTNNVDIYKALELLKNLKLEKLTFGFDNELKKIFNNIDIPYIENCINIAEEELETKFSDTAYSALIMHVAFALKRIEQGKDILMPKEEVASLQTTKEFAAASGIVKMLENRFNLIIPIDEIGYMAIHLLGSNVTTTRKIDDEWIELQVLTNKLITGVSSSIGRDLSCDSQLFDGLIQHMRPTIYRLKHGLMLKNPLLTEIKSTYGNLFDAIKESVYMVEEFAKSKMSDEEVGYFTLHFGAAMERNENDKTRANVLVVCATGIGTSKFVSSKLQSIFNVNVIDTIPYHQMKEILSNRKVDVVISTVPIKTEINNVKCIEVSPFLTQKNISDISLELSKYSNKSNGYKYADLSEIMSIIRKSCSIKDSRKLTEDLSNYFNMKNNMEKGVVQPVLEDVLTAQSIRLNVDADNWEEAVRVGGDLLEVNGYIEHKYVQAMVDTVKNIGPYIVIAPGIAMPHARPESGVKKIGLSLITLKKPVNFGNKENDPVHIVVCLCAIDHSSHIKALSELVTFLGNQKFIDTVLKAKDPFPIIDFIKKGEDSHA